MSVKPTEQKEEHDEESDDEQDGEVVHYVLFGGACISTYPTIATILQIFIVIILWLILNALRSKVQVHKRSLSSFFVLFSFPICIWKMS